MKVPMASFGLVIVLLWAADLAAQTMVKPKAGADLDTLEAKAFEKLKGISYRERFSAIDPRDNNDNPYVSYFQTTDYLRPDRMHSIYEAKYRTGRTNRLERILIRESRYVNRNNEGWKTEAPPAKSAILPGDVHESITDSLDPRPAIRCGAVNFEYFGVLVTKKCESLGKERIGGRVARKYQITQTESDGDTRPEVRVVRNFEVKTFWFDDAGRYIKIETIRRTHSFPGVVWRAVQEYEYTKSLKIEAPIK